MKHANDTDTRQLQFWNPAKRVYEPSAHQGNLDPDDVRSFACGRAWRIAKAERPVKNPRHNPPRHNSHSRTIDQMQRQYLDWAASRGLPSVTIWADKSQAFVRSWIAGKFKAQPDILAVTPDYFDVRESVDAVAAVAKLRV